jgi:hypothetical protein
MAKLAQLAANAMADALDAYANTGGVGKIIIYGSSGGSVPSTADTALTIPSQHQILVTFDSTHGVVQNPMFGNAGANSPGRIDLNGVPLTTPATATGTATFFRIYQNNGTTVVAQGTVGTASADLILNTVAITNGVNVTITSGTITMPT